MEDPRDARILELRRAGHRPYFPVFRPISRSEFSEAAIARFLGKVDRSLGVSACWPWASIRNQDGYGIFRVAGKAYRAHRVAVAVECGAIEATAVVMHACDNPCCVNPAHLRIGSIADNNADMLAKGRVADSKGGKNSQSKLSAEDVLDIRARSLRGEPRSKIASAYSTSYWNICCIVTGRRWAHLPGAVAPRKKAKARSRSVSSAAAQVGRQVSQVSSSLHAPSIGDQHQ